MGRKVHPIGFRLGITKNWLARWYAEGREYVELLHEDLKIRQFVKEQLKEAGIARIEIERFPKQINLYIHAARPGIVIGRRGLGIKQLRQAIEEMTGKKARVEIVEVPKPELEAAIVAESIAQQIEKRVSHARAMKRAIQQAMRAGAKGIRITVSGRLGGAEMARTETLMEGRVPRHTLRADIDYALAEAITKWGKIGIKVWIYRGDTEPGAYVQQTAEMVARVTSAQRGG